MNPQMSQIAQMAQIKIANPSVDGCEHPQVGGQAQMTNRQQRWAALAERRSALPQGRRLHLDTGLGLADFPESQALAQALGTIEPEHVKAHGFARPGAFGQQTFDQAGSNACGSRPGEERNIHQVNCFGVPRHKQAADGAVIDQDNAVLGVREFGEIMLLLGAKLPAQQGVLPGRGQICQSYFLGSRARENFKEERFIVRPNRPKSHTLGQQRFLIIAVEFLGRGNLASRWIGNF